MTTLCSIGSRFAKKADPGAFQTMPWSDAFRRQHSFDAHVLTYVSDRRLGTGDEDGVMCNVVLLDYDESNDHLDVLERIVSAEAGSPASQYAVVYPTKGGMRIGYRLSRPVAAKDFAPIVKALAFDLWQKTGLRVDPTTDQWHRMFRLPQVLRDDEKSKGSTWEQPYFFETVIVEDALLDVDKLRPYTGRLPWDGRGAKSEAPADAPGFDETLPSDRLAVYKHAFKHSRYKTYLFQDGAPPQGRRDQVLLSVASEVVRIAYTQVPNPSAEEVYLFLRPLADRLEADGSESWQKKLWRFVSHAWNGEVKKQAEREAKDEAERSLREVLVERMLNSVPGNTVPNDAAERIAFARRHYCLQTASGAYVIQKDGTYSMTPLKTSQLPAHFNDGLLFLDENGFRNDSGRPLAGQEILNDCSTIISDVEYIAGPVPGARLRIQGHRRVLEVTPFALRPDLVATAQFDKDIGDWLDSFADANKLKRWLASALALAAGPTSALYLHGPARVGKSLLCQAIAECFDTQPVPGAQAFADFNGALMNSPVVMVDEGLPTRMQGMDTADMFRSLVTGGPVSVQRKYMDALNSKIPYRLMFAANSYDMVKHLIGRRTMESNDRDAFRERILVIDTGNRPADYLDQRGAMAFTRFNAKGSWLGGECRLARHLIKLYQTYFEEQNFIRDGRLLVEGENHPAFMLAFDLGGNGHEIVDELVGDISRMVDRKLNGTELPKAMRIEGSTVWLKRRPYIKILLQRIPRIRSASAATALERFSTGRQKIDQMDLSQMFEVDLEKLMFCAKAEGLPVAHLEALRIQSVSS